MLNKIGQERKRMRERKGMREKSNEIRKEFIVILRERKKR